MPHRTLIRCPHCGYVMATTDGPQLFIAGVIVRRSVVIHCAQADCRGKRNWQPCEIVKREEVAA